MAKKKRDAPESWCFGSIPLRLGGGWVSALQQALSTLPEVSYAQWEELVAHAGSAMPRHGGQWAHAEAYVDCRCSHPQIDVPVPEPGSQAYQDALAGGVPDPSWLERVRDLANAFGEGEVARVLAILYRCATQSSIGTLNREAPNRQILRGLIWFVAAIGDPGMIDALRELAVWSIDHRTAQAKTIGIALAYSESEQAAGALRMIETAARRPYTKTRFGRYASHVEHKVGMDPADSAEKFVPTLGLDRHGKLRTNLGGDGSIEVCIQGSRVILSFWNSGGRQVKTAPAAMRAKHGSTLLEARSLVKNLAQLLRIQRRRLESLFLTSPTWNLTMWQERYLDHPVVGTLTRRLVWEIDGVACFFIDRDATNVRGESITISPSSQLRLWHPLDRRPEEVLAWRERLQDLGITQPFKQVYREIYVVTDAERQTGTYSNRFAAHILRQAQFRALARESLWRSELMGGWDQGDNGIASRELPNSWRVELWIKGVPTDAHAWNVATDQVRFYAGTTDRPSTLDDVPRLIFSEAMRDVDLFVGVASVGNDPAWQDGGPEGRYRDYWWRYTTDELSATGAVRREVLARLLPRLKVANQCSLTDRYLVVNGRERRYRIHLGSGSVFMEPNGQFLCIVADPSPPSADEFFLPFEGDSMLSLIVSKALMLAEDWKISDPTIVRQIAGG
jgi:hypothetical protein